MFSIFENILFWLIEKVFWYDVKVYTLKVYSICYILRQNTNSKKSSFRRNKCYKKCTFWASAHHNFSFNSRFPFELKHKVHHSKIINSLNLREHQQKTFVTFGGFWLWRMCVCVCVCVCVCSWVGAPQKLTKRRNFKT